MDRQPPICWPLRKRQVNRTEKTRPAGRVRPMVLGIMLLLVSIAACFPMVQAAEPSLVYVAGNPNLYPIEYYDVNENTFKGVIPELLREFSAQGRYRIEYINSGVVDQRYAKYKNKQAELISGCVIQDGFPDEVWQNGMTVLQTQCDGELCEYRILLSQVADEALKQELTSFLSAVPENRRNGLVIESAKSKTGYTPSVLLTVIGGLTALYLVIVILLIRRYRKKLSVAKLRLATDEVTGIGNYDYLTRYYKQEITDKNRILYSMIYFYTDTNRLRRFSDNQETNEFLRYMAIILNQYTADTDILARVADGGFVLMKLTSSQEEVQQWIRPVLQRLKAYSAQYEKSFPCQVFAGIYPLKRSDRDIDAIIFNAEQSCYYAHDNGLEVAVCNREIMRTCEDEHGLMERLHDALEKEEFGLYLHFFVNAQTDEIVGAEALSRWNHPEKGLLTPGRYIPLMEKEKIISKLDFYMLERVCMVLEELYSQQAGDFFISCNFSRDTFTAPNFVENCIGIIQKYRFPREALILEVTENGLASDTSILYQNALRMKEYGTSIALDDFGSGCSDFFDLEKYHFDALKLDRGLIDALNTQEGQIILEGIIQIGHRLNMTILAEGVELPEQVQTLQQLNCDVIQGFYFYQPMPVYEAKKLYLQQETKV